MGDWVALLRGINVGPAKRVPMAELRAAYERFGLSDVQTLLNSGNVVFSSGGDPDPEALRAAVREATGTDSETIVVSASRFRAIADANPLRAADRTPSHVIVAFATAPVVPSDVAPPAADVLAPEEIVVTADAFYQWLPDGVLQTKIPPAFWRGLGTTFTARNQQTVEKIVALLDKRAS